MKLEATEDQKAIQRFSQFWFLSLTPRGHCRGEKRENPSSFMEGPRRNTLNQTKSKFLIIFHGMKLLFEFNQYETLD